MSRGWVDPSIKPDTVQQARTLAAIRAYPGASLHRLHGSALRLTAPGIHLTVANLGSLSVHDLDPNRK